IVRRINGIPAYRDSCQGLTFAYLAVSIMPFWMEDSQYMRLIKADGVGFISAIIVIMTIFVFLIFGLLRRTCSIGMVSAFLQFVRTTKDNATIRTAMVALSI